MQCTSRSLDYIKKEPSGDLGDDKTALFCSGMAFNLEKLQNRILNLAKSFDNQLPFLHDITDEMAHWETTQNRGTSKKHRKDGAKVQNTKELMNPSEKYLKAKTDLQDTRHYLGRWNDSYYRFWSVFIKRCDLTKYSNLMDPKELTKRGNFLMKEIELPEDMRGTSSKWAFL
ncbi:hypothetical protein BASA50_005713 [Batrachochytrium salamandrivorans]|uniref:Uncharacterized protein n=1 Tax=Batrachochytrium salamandrivorans TaxID=1357716 RepID=A0ABQ8FF24_9FUNG|nr:hypothetical protein BASA50_005713 [Batrachochytrium salamandrivorans]